MMVSYRQCAKHFRHRWLLLVLGLGALSCSSRSSNRSNDRRGAARATVPTYVPIFAKPAFAQAPTVGATQVTLSDIAERAVKSVVNISTSRAVRLPQGLSPFYGNPFFHDPYGQRGAVPEQRAQSLGSGVIVSSDGIVITNNHVVKDADEIRVTLHDGRTLAAKAVATDPKSDVAVVRLQGDLRGITPIRLGDSAKLRLGEVVLAIGNPFGVGQTVTMGIVSAIGRANMGIVDYEDFIQTDAAINPGNSGGALVNMRAELVGINTAILSKSGGYQGIGFAIPSAMVDPISKSLLAHGRVVRGWLGVVIQDLNKDIATALKLSVDKGILVADVQADSPGAKAGILRGDVITRVNGQPTTTTAHLRSMVATSGPNSTLTLTIMRQDKTRDVAVKLEELPSERVATLDRSQGILGGLTLAPMTDDKKQALGLPPRAQGAVIARIEPGSAADKAGLRPDDVLLEINRQPITNPTEFANTYRQAAGKVLLLVYRGGTTMYLLLEK